METLVIALSCCMGNIIILIIIILISLTSISVATLQLHTYKVFSCWCFGTNHRYRSAFLADLRLFVDRDSEARAISLPGVRQAQMCAFRSTTAPWRRQAPTIDQLDDTSATRQQNIQLLFKFQWLSMQRINLQRLHHHPIALLYLHAFVQHNCIVVVCFIWRTNGGTYFGQVHFTLVTIATSFFYYRKIG